MIWSLCLPPCIKPFAWRIYKRILPTNSNLARHMPSWNMNCPICGHHEESDMHALLECPLAVQVWGGSQLNCGILDSKFRNMEDCIASASMMNFDVGKIGHGFTESLVEEALACLLGMRRTLEAGFDSIMVEGDCLSLILSLGKNKVHDSFVGFTLKDILSLVSSFDFCSWPFVKRGGNRVAHDVVHLQPYGFCLRTWETKVPDCIVDRAFEDMYEFLNSNIE
ncbi:hypothetical protein Cgig2_024682 [Carnegiea gigantea]|uniref:RNase H type-1 domain-containing protein n=1 Tax=Carnegiea gigantea TaxID=171969 RepID=A0A9Q1Q9I7_9CARY|nr:hypothetical protein Cgig2_024682 [Carnegiea gigantea]